MKLKNNKNRLDTQYEYQAKNRKEALKMKPINSKIKYLVK